MLTAEVVSAMRKVYSDTEARQVKMARVVEYVYIGDKQVVECAECGEYFFLNQVTVHHTTPVIPPQITYKEMSYQMFYSRLFCSWKNLQLLCSPCHRGKVSKEDQERTYWRDRKKQLVCRSRVGGKMTVNPILDLKCLDPKWEVMAVAETRKQADNLMRKWRKL